MDWSGFGLPPDEQAVLNELVSAIQAGAHVNYAGYFSRINGLNEARLHDLMHALAHLAAGAGSPGATVVILPRLYTAYLVQHPGSSAAYAGLADSRAQAGSFGPAVAAYTKSLGLGGGPEVYFGRGAAAEELGDHEFAFRDATQALSLDPDSSQAQALAKLSQGRPSKAHVDAATGEVGAAQAPAGSFDAEALGQTSWDGERGSPKAGAPRVSAEMAQEAQRFLQLSDAKSAIAAASRAAALDPRSAKAYNLLATAQARAGNFSAALDAADRALSLAPRNPAALTTRSWALSGLKRFEEASDDANSAVLYAPNEGSAYLSKARAQAGLNQRAAMLDSLARAAALDPRLEGLAEAASRLPDSADPELLFAGLQAGQPAAPAGGRGRFPLGVMLVTVLGGLMIALGLLRLSSPRLAEGFTTRMLGRPDRTGPVTGRLDPEPRGLAGIYELRRVIATGGMGIVYEAFDTGLKRRVAVKKMRGEIRDDPRERERFLLEARTVAALQHPNIVQIHSILEEGADIYLVFGFVEGRTLKELISARGRLPASEAVPLLADVCAALEYAHGRGVVHRDLKPSNIMVAPDARALVMDFGVARQAKDALIKAATTNTILGTPTYMAPEAEGGVVRRESDLYSLGVCLYEAVTGRLPFAGTGSAMWAAKLAGRFEPPSSLASVPRGLDEVLARALAPEPQERFSTAAQLGRALSALSA